MKVESLETIFAALNQAEVKYLVVGGLAVVAHGYVRTTEDVDLVIRLNRENILRGLEALENVGYRIALPVTAEQFADEKLREQWHVEKQMQVLKLWSDVHRRTPIDIFVCEPFDFDEELNNSVSVDLAEKLSVPVVSLPTLIQMKREAARPQDLADIDELEKLS